MADRTTARQRVIVLVALLGSAALFSGACAGPSATPSPSADAWAVVNGREITGDEVDKAYRRVSQGDAAPSEDELLAAKLTVLNELIAQDLLVAKAQAIKIEVTDAELDAAYAEARQDIPDEAFQKELARRGLAAADMREALRRDLLSQKVIEQEVMSKVQITDQDVADFYNANRAQFALDEDAYHIAQIVVTPVRDPEVANQSGDDATTPADAARKAQMLMSRLKEGASFSELARQFSEDPQSAPRGGDLGFVPVSALKEAPAPLRDAVLQSSPGTIKVVSINGAHTLVLLVAEEKAGQRDLTTPGVRERISATLRERKAQLLRTAYLSVLRNEADVVNYFARRLVESQGRMPSLAPQAPGTR